MILQIGLLITVFAIVFFAGRELGKKLGVKECEPLLNRYHAMVETMLKNDDNVTALLRSMSQDIDTIKNQLYETNSQKH